MNGKKIFYGAVLLLLTGVLSACSKQQAEFKQAFAEEFDKSFRSEFIASFTQQCVTSIPKEANVPADVAQKLCACSAEKSVETITPADMSKWMTGDKEVERRVMAAAEACMQELQGSQGEQARQ